MARFMNQAAGVFTGRASRNPSGRAVAAGPLGGLVDRRDWVWLQN